MGLHFGSIIERQVIFKCPTCKEYMLLAQKLDVKWAVSIFLHLVYNEVYTVMAPDT
jgi:hypothetical protein